MRFKLDICLPKRPQVLIKQGKVKITVCLSDYCSTIDWHKQMKVSYLIMYANKVFIM